MFRAMSQSMSKHSSVFLGRRAFHSAGREECSTPQTRLFKKSQLFRTQTAKLASSIRNNMIFAAIIFVTFLQCIVVWSFWNAGPIEGPLGEVHGLVPSFGFGVVRFNSTREDGARAMDDLDPGWTKLMPVGSGFITVKGWDEHANTLPPPIRLDGHEIFSVAVFHQLHCLHYLLKEFNNLLNVDNTRQKEHQHEHGNDGDYREDTVKHAGHCFDYLRNSLTCCGDTAFEGQSSDDTDHPGTLGEGSYHMCKNYDKIKAWAQASRGTNMRGFSD